MEIIIALLLHCVVTKFKWDNVFKSEPAVNVFVSDILYTLLIQSICNFSANDKLI